VRAIRERQVEVMTAFDVGALVALGGSGEKVLHYALTWSPFLVAIGSVIAAVKLSNWSLILGIPLALVGMSLSSPVFMRNIGIWLNRVLTAVMIYFLYRGSVISALLVLSYLGPNFLCHVARHHCRLVLVRAAEESELVTVWLFSKGSLLAVARSSSVGS